MPMGALNLASVFVAFSNMMKVERNKVAAAKSGINADKAGAKVMVDNIIAYALDSATLMTHIGHILDTMHPPLSGYNKTQEV
jgi:hypothetical protein